MKLSLFFIAMDIITLMIYPAVFVFGRLRWMLKTKESVVLENSLPPVIVILDKPQI